MRNLRIGLTLAALLLLPSSAMAAITQAPNGHKLSVMLRNGVRGGGGGGGSKGGAGGVLVNHRGPVLQGEIPYLIYWTPPGYPIATSSEGLLNQYLTDTAADSSNGKHGASLTNVYSVLGQYGAPYAQTFGSAQVIVDTDPYPAQQTGCTIAAGLSACVTDAALQAEITNVINSRQLALPTPGQGSTPIFFMITPVNVNVCTGGNVCASNNFCAYHSYFTSGNQDVLYASVPFEVFNGNPKGCQTDQYSVYETPAGSGGDEAYNIADDLSHELSETITDPLINAWYSHQGLEVGDLCEAYGASADTSKGFSPLAYWPAFGDPTTGTLYDQVIAGDQYYNQTEYSNANNGCMAGLSPLPGTPVS